MIIVSFWQLFYWQQYLQKNKEYLRLHRSRNTEHRKLLVIDITTINNIIHQYLFFVTVNKRKPPNVSTQHKYHLSRLPCPSYPCPNNTPSTDNHNVWPHFSNEKEHNENCNYIMEYYVVCSTLIQCHVRNCDANGGQIYAAKCLFVIWKLEQNPNFWMGTLLIQFR